MLGRNETRLNSKADFISIQVRSSEKKTVAVINESGKFRYLGILFICHTMTIKLQKDAKKKCRKRWRGGLKETIELMLIRPPQLQFFEDGIKITATDTI